jgi:hypothetical protein
MAPFFIFKVSGNHIEVWYDGSEVLPGNTRTVISPNGWITDELALAWLEAFNKAITDRTKRGEK